MVAHMVLLQVRHTCNFETWHYVLTVNFEVAELLRDGLGNVSLALPGRPRVRGAKLLRGGRAQL